MKAYMVFLTGYDCDIDGLISSLTILYMLTDTLNYQQYI